MKFCQTYIHIQIHTYATGIGPIPVAYVCICIVYMFDRNFMINKLVYNNESLMIVMAFNTVSSCKYTCTYIYTNITTHFKFQV